MKPSVAAGLQAKAAQAQASELAQVSRKLDLIMAHLGLTDQAPVEPQEETPVEPEAPVEPEPEALVDPEDKSEAITEPIAAIKPAGRSKKK